VTYYTFQHDVRSASHIFMPAHRHRSFLWCACENLIHVAPQSLTKTELASRPHYHVVQFPYEIIRVSEDTNQQSKRCLHSPCREIPSRTRVGNEIVALIGKQLVVRVEGLVVTCNIVVPIVFCTYQVWNPTEAAV
jgi:hypothetical protein